MANWKGFKKKIRDPQLIKKINKTIQKIAEDPYQAGSPKKGILKGIYCAEIKHQGTDYRLAYTIHDKTKDVVLGYVGTRENFYNELQQKAIKSKRFVLEEQQTDQNQKSTDKQPKPTKKKPPKNRQKNQGKSKRFAPDLGNSELVTNNFYDMEIEPLSSLKKNPKNLPYLLNKISTQGSLI